MSVVDFEASLLIPRAKQSVDPRLIINAQSLKDHVLQTNCLNPAKYGPLALTMQRFDIHRAQLAMALISMSAPGRRSPATSIAVNAGKGSDMYSHRILLNALKCSRSPT